MITTSRMPVKSLEMDPAEFLRQQQALVLRLQQQTAAAVSNRSVANRIPSEARDQVTDRYGSFIWEHVKGVLLLAVLYSTLVLTVYISGQN